MSKRLLLTLAAGFICTSCTKHTSNVKEATVEQAAQYVNNSTATIVDANDDEYRTAAGVIPGAVLLTSFSGYDLKQLPADKARALVFYCTSRL